VLQRWLSGRLRRPGAAHGALGSLGSQSNEVAERRAANAALAAGAPAALLAAMRAHADDAELRKHAPRALAGLLLNGEAWPGGRGAAAWHDVRAALVALIAEHGCLMPYENEPDVTALALAACALAWRPGDGDAPAAGAAPPGAAKALCIVLRTAVDVQDAKVLRCAEMRRAAGMACAVLATQPGEHGAAFCADACGAGLVQHLVTAAARAARPAGGPGGADSTPCLSAMRALAALAASAPAAACTAAACGAHALVDAYQRTQAFADAPAERAEAAVLMAGRLHALAASHEEGRAGCCATTDGCELLLMSDRRCCLRGCAAVATDAAPLKRCSGCRRAAFCCAEHQAQAWPRHKAACKARAAVEAARAALLAHDAAASAAPGDEDA
jgi:hypothetical protein